MRRACACGTVLSQYNPSRFCSVCEPQNLTHAAYTATIDPAGPIRVARKRGDEFCTRGHDLATHGVLRNTGGGRMTRKCRACDRIRHVEYRARKRLAA